VPKWLLPTLVWGVFLSGFIVWLLPIPESEAKTWTGIVAIILGLLVVVFIVGMFTEIGVAGFVGIAALGGIVFVVSEVYERAGGWFVALVAIIGGGVYLYNKDKQDEGDGRMSAGQHDAFPLPSTEHQSSRIEKNEPGEHLLNENFPLSDSVSIAADTDTIQKLYLFYATRKPAVLSLEDHKELEGERVLIMDMRPYRENQLRDSKPHLFTPVWYESHIENGKLSGIEEIERLKLGSINLDVKETIERAVKEKFVVVIFIDRDHLYDSGVVVNMLPPEFNILASLS